MNDQERDVVTDVSMVFHLDEVVTDAIYGEKVARALAEANVLRVGESISIGYRRWTRVEDTLPIKFTQEEVCSCGLIVKAFAAVVGTRHAVNVNGRCRTDGNAWPCPSAIKHHESVYHRARVSFSSEGVHERDREAVPTP